MKKLNGHHKFIISCVVLGVACALYGNDIGMGTLIAVWFIFSGYCYYGVWLLLKKHVNNPKVQKDNEKKRRKTTVVNATIIESGTTYKTKGGLGSAVVGGALFGGVGAVVGASIGKKTISAKTVRFLVEYLDGHKQIEDVKVDSIRYKQLIKFL